VLKSADEPLVLPGDGLIDDLLVGETTVQGRFGGESGRMLSLLDEDGGFIADPVGLLRHADGLDDWM